MATAQAAPTEGTEETQEDPVVAEPEMPIEDIEPQAQPVPWRIEGELTNARGETEAFMRQYIQKPLSYMGMMELTGLFGRVIDRAMSSGATLDDIAGAFNLQQGTLSSEDAFAVNSFVSTLAKIASYVPDVMEECYCIWLRVPLVDRPFVREIWSKPVDEGGMSMDDGEKMLTVFIEQNWNEVETFFVERLGRVRNKVVEARKKRVPEQPSD